MCKITIDLLDYICRARVILLWHDFVIFPFPLINKTLFLQAKDQCGPMANELPQTGIDTLLENKELIRKFSQQKVALLTNQSALTKDFVPTADALSKKLRGALRCILTPEHGWSASIAEGEKIKDGRCSVLGLPIYSLYGGDKRQLEDVLGDIDVLLIDLQDVGVRCYTYPATCAKLLEKMSKDRKEVIICDRPNPLGIHQRGPMLDPEYRSFLAFLDIPFQHGQTLGELLLTYNQSLQNGPLSLKVLSGERICRPFAYPWVPPSPNLPTWESILLYPGLVLLEGTNVSEGRGTSLPFTCIGAPDLDNQALVDFLNNSSGIRARPVIFTPQSGKLKGQECHGAHLLVTDFLRLDAFSLGLKLLFFLKQNYASFKWTEMEHKKGTYFIDYLLGTPMIRQTFDESLPIGEILEKFT